GNVILLGAAAALFTIIDKETLYHSIERIFGSKGEAVVEMNHRAFNIGYEYSLKKIN
ncbi:MAG: 2-oxoacid:acceptor oxidoreductase family protein, partial [Candidatus Phocaeicola faecipullorum]|nr:2-oxoacid:acceptor oxidoreductase family protein [Candidatus Phocaeicola faecipullorum]